MEKVGKVWKKTEEIRGEKGSELGTAQRGFELVIIGRVLGLGVSSLFPGGLHWARLGPT